MKLLLSVLLGGVALFGAGCIIPLAHHGSHGYYGHGDDGHYYGGHHHSGHHCHHGGGLHVHGR